MRPDILTTAKSIAAGIPLSAIVARKEIMDAPAKGTIGGTYCGNPLACAAGLKVIEIMKRDGLEKRAMKIGNTVMDRKSKEPAPELTEKIIRNCASNGLLVEGAGTYNNVIRFLAPLVITDLQLDAGLDIMDNAISESVLQGCG